MKTALLLFVTLIANAVSASTEVTLLHFADYHSHALPFYSEGRPQQGGIARAIGYLRGEQTRGALVFSGGDMINKGSPAWSDKYGCVEWPWLDGIVAAMAFGNHDSDYGADGFQRCASSVKYPILSANVVDAKGKLLFRPYKVLQRNGVRIGVFAIAGPDFDTLVKPDQRPAAGARFTDRIAAARDVVKRLRDQEHVDAVVMIGHEHHDDDFELAGKVPGIDVIFGTHSHRKDGLQQIPGTTTWFISPFQYLTYVSRIVMTFEGHRLARVTGGLVPVDASMPGDAKVAARVATLQHDLESDPKYADLFRPIGVRDTALDVLAVGTKTVQVMRQVSDADVAISTVSSFRQAIPSGPLTMEALRGALPYDNEIVVAALSGANLQKLLDLAREGVDGGAYIDGLPKVDPGRTYRVATTDYMARIAARYRDAFAGAKIESTGKRVRDELRKALTSKQTSLRRPVERPATSPGGAAE